jgi:hypothetical protein
MVKQLKPRAQAERARPLKLAAVALTLGQRRYRPLLALRLLGEHFPGALAELKDRDVSGPGWWGVLGYCIGLAGKAGWFDVDWKLVEDAWFWWGLKPDRDRGSLLATFLHHLPLRLHGFHKRIFGYPPMRLLQALLTGPPIEVTTPRERAIELADLFENWTEADRQAAWGRLVLARLPEPLRRLPELARWACHRTGNPILDRTFDPESSESWFTWAGDLPAVRRYFRQARPLIEELERLMAWYERDPNRHLAMIADILTEDYSQENSHDE